MRKQTITMAPLCDSCKTASATLFCKPDSAYLCIPCDGKIHAANKLASRHERVWMCDVCEQAPASVTCKADAAALCVTCDHDIHSANPLARRHERFPVVPFHDPSTAVVRKFRSSDTETHYCDVNAAETDEEEAEADLWLLPNPNLNINRDGSEDDDLKDDMKVKVAESESDFLFTDIDALNPYLGIDLKTPEQKAHQIGRLINSQSDGVVPVQNKSDHHHHYTGSDVVEGLPVYEVDYAGSKPFMYNFTTQSISQSVSSSSLEIEVGVVPDHNAAMVDVSNNNHFQSSTEVYPTPLIGFDREARVLRYREKKKNRKFEKTIRYASRKAYAETRPRVKGRFAKRTETKVVANDTIISPESSYGVVPSY
ncbi:hypothetical protein QVD17_13849 [Tagetes erecta]|uniref:CONSTANS-like protein n=1 Tax=Tagetes erecta TaxID=13708 RepID=A0AAD8KWA9_TARER|nr:hypothetical protein QVD17_13849 [Tagetes erecta]